MVINFNGNVGIGVDNPSYKLDVDGNAHLTSDLDVGGNAHFLNNVNIGTTTSFPQITNENGEPYKLAVAGGILTQEVNVKLNEGNWPDYVFVPNYDLMSLEKVEQFISTNKHLPLTPSASILSKSGLELKSMTINQQRNIEEIYLHLIALNHRITDLEKENKELKTQLKP